MQEKVIDSKIKELKEKLNDYFSGKLSDKDLGKWANSIYYDILRGGYLRKDKLVIYPFVKKIAQFGIEINESEDRYPIEEHEVCHINDILHGRCNFDFQINISIPLILYNNSNNEFLNMEHRHLFEKLLEEIEQYELQKTGLENLQENARKIIKLPIDDTVILADLQRMIVQYCKTFIFLNLTGNEKIARLYAKKVSESPFEKLKTYLKYYLGEKSFQVGISYEKGKVEYMIFY